MTSIFWQMEDDLDILSNGRRPQYFGKMEEDLNVLATTSIFWKMEDDINFFETRKWTHFVFNWKMTLNLMKGK